ncbi:AfsR/SARP family transcriptional regulator [Actinomadura formosensis]|uniref:AfsR/SARP family transcriptional regulator n=1 Tax=Actinomadura formosensis TaxID=60706 RepID=UPI00082EEBF6|nr:tetratricopeptide repeat protein [Actinomadura formosensis]
MEFRVIGPVELWIDGRRRDLGTTKERCVLAVLLLNPRQPVPAEALIRRVWDDAPPAKARQSLYSYMTRLRHRLDGVDGAELVSRQGSYLIDVADESVDLQRFRLLRDQARAIAESGDEEYALDHYRRAAALWRAEPLADLTGGWAARARHTLEQELLTAAFERIDVELRRGHHADLVHELSDLAERHPQDQRPVERLMVALYRCGRQAEALEVYRRTHDLFVQESGTDPGPGLRDLQQRILRTDPALLRVPGTQLNVDRPPHNLPHDSRAFAGRDAELRQLLDMVPSAREPGSGVTVISLDGMPGVGKTALAVRLAHRLAERFPDGQIFLELHAHDARRDPVDPAEALDTLLRMIGVPATRVPRTLGERAALWRSQLASSRAILVLDDAAGHDQVRPLLPASAGCLVIVTSRRRLTGLHDSFPLSLDVLPVRDAAALFTGIAGAGRARGGADVTAVVERCGRLPLAVLMAASRLRHRRAWDVGDLLARLDADDRRLDELRDESREITAVFEVSYRGLPAPLRDAFRVFGLHPGPDLTAHTAAAALARPVREAERVLEELLDRHLITEPVGGRYRFHNLVHDYARRLAGELDPPDARRGTVHRILDFYLAAADLANRRLSRSGGTPAGRPPADLPPLADEAAAAAWFSAEHDCLLNAAAEAERTGLPRHVTGFARLLAGHLESRGRWDEAERLHTRAIAVLRTQQDRRGLARALADRSLVRFRSGEYDLALEDAEKALMIFRSLGERRGEADILGHISLIHWHRSRLPEALARCREALDIRRSIGDRHGEARSLDHAAIFLEFAGEYREAERLRLRALAIFTELDDPRGRTMALNNMGDLVLRMGNVETAVEYYERTAAAAAELGRQHQAIVLINLANVSRHTGDHEKALENYRKALAIAMEIGDRRNQVETLIGIGATFHDIGRHGEALIHYERALAISRMISERYEETLALRHLGETLAASGRYPAAVDHFRQAHDQAARIGVPYELAKALEGLGAALLHVQGRDKARACWQQAARVFDSIGLPEAETLRARLRELDKATGT